MVLAVIIEVREEGGAGRGEGGGVNEVRVVMEGGDGSSGVGDSCGERRWCWRQSWR